MSVTRILALLFVTVARGIAQEGVSDGIVDWKNAVYTEMRTAELATRFHVSPGAAKEMVQTEIACRYGLEALGVRTDRLAVRVDYVKGNAAYGVGENSIVVDPRFGAPGMNAMRQAMWGRYQIAALGGWQKYVSHFTDASGGSGPGAAKFLAFEARSMGLALHVFGREILMNGGNPSSRSFLGLRKLAADWRETLGKIGATGYPRHHRTLEARLWQLSLESPLPRANTRAMALRGQLRGAAAGQLRFMGGYLFDQTLQAVEQGDTGKIAEALRSMASPVFVRDLALFGTVSGLMERPVKNLGLAQVPRFLRAPLRGAIPMAAAGALVEYATTGHADVARSARTAAAYAVSGSLVNTLLESTVGRALVAGGPRGWLSTGLYEAVKIGFTLHAGGRIERALFPMEKELP